MLTLITPKMQIKTETQLLMYEALIGFLLLLDENSYRRQTWWNVYFCKLLVEHK